MNYQTTQLPFAMLYRSLRKDIHAHLVSNLDNEEKAEKLSRLVFVRLRKHYGRPTFYVFGHLLWIITSSQIAKRRADKSTRNIFKRFTCFLSGSIAEYRQYRTLIALIERRLDRETQSHLSENLPELTKKQKTVLQQYICYINRDDDNSVDLPSTGSKSRKHLVNAIETLNPVGESPADESPVMGQACQWLIDLENEGLKASDLKQFDRWLQRDKQNKKAFKQLEATVLNVSAVMQ
jgi:hypothetical protein